MLKIVGVVGFYGINELLYELFGGDIKDNLIWKLVLNSQTYRMKEVGFTKSNVTVDEQRIERGFAWLVCNGISCRTSKTIAGAFHEIIERIAFHKLRIDLYFL